MSAVPSHARLLCVALCATFLLAFAPGALAATLTLDGSGNVVYTGGADLNSVVGFDEIDSDTVQVLRSDDISFTDNDPITVVGTDCTDDGGGTSFTCDNVTGGVIASGGNFNDGFDASGDNTPGNGLTTKAAQFDGGDDSDSLFGGAADDILHGGNGDDTVFGDFGSGPGGNDQVFGDAGYDRVAGGLGNDIVDGGADDDEQVAGGPGNDTVSGGDGDEDVHGGPGDDTVDGGAGNDDVVGDCDGVDNCGAGDDGNDTVNGGAGNDDVQGDGGNDVLHGNDGNDDVDGEGGCCGNSDVGGDDQLFGDAGDDDLRGMAGNDTMDGGTENDDVNGGPGNDTAAGGDSEDEVQGGPGDDVIDGGNGDDYVTGDCGGYLDCGGGRPDGNDTVTGGAGNDYTDADGGTDTTSGGSGFDQIGYADRYYDCTGDDGCVQVSHPVSVTLDAVANDGGAGENDNVLEIEDVSVYDEGCCGSDVPEGGASILGDAGTNSLSGAGANDTIDGGAGNDFLNGNAGDDTLNADDGFADRVICGAGNDTANVDPFDSLSDDCEVVNRSTRANLATEDAPPTVAFASPAAGSKLSTSKANTLTATATDDKGVVQVVFLNGDRILCADTTAPYTCDYKPIGEDVGKDTLTAVAFDASQQTATANREFRIERFKPRRPTAKTTPKVDSTFPFTFTTKGKLRLPSAVDESAGCKGKVTVRFKAGKKTVSTRRARVHKNCRYRSKVTFSLPGRLHPRQLRVFVRFRGNAVLKARSHKVYKVRVS